MSEEAPSRTGPLLVLLVLAVLVGIGLYIAHRLHDTARIQDCVASGRSNCAPIATTP